MTTKNRLLNFDFFATIIIPLAIFYIFNYHQNLLWGAILSGAWCCGFFLFRLIINKKTNILALLTGIFSVISLLITIIFHDPKFYFLEPIFSDFIYSVIFFGSLFFSRSLIQIFVEDSKIISFSSEYTTFEKYIKTWKILTIIWGSVMLLLAAIKLLIFYCMSINVYYAVSKTYSAVINPLLIIGSYKFPKWYWHKAE